MKGINEITSASETDMIVVTLPSQKLKARKKLWLEGTIGKWIEAQKVKVPHKNSGSAVASAAPISVSQSEFFL